MSHGYAVTNALTGLEATAFTWSSAYATNRGRLNDGILDEIASSASSAQASGQTLVINMGSATALVGFALLNHNLASGSCTVEVQYDQADNPTFPNPVTAKAASTIVTTAPNQKDTILQLATGQPYRYWRLVFVHTGTKIVTIGEVLAFTAITTLSRTTIYGGGESERYIVNENDSGTGHHRSTFVGGPLRTKRLPFSTLSASEKAELMTMWRAVQGSVSNLLWIETIGATASAATAAEQECLWGKLKPSTSWTQDDYGVFTPDGFELVGQGREVGS